MRICTFLPSATEIVYALGLGDSLYGVSHECDFPAGARAKPKVVRSRFDPADYTSQEIDRMVADMASRGERIYEVDVSVLEKAGPDLVITQELCEVCAVSFDDVQEAVSHLDQRPQLISLDPTRLSDVVDDVRRVAEATGTEGSGREIVAGLRERIEAARARTSAAPRPRVACIEWLDPLIVAGHWIPDMVDAAGGTDVLGREGEPSRRIAFDELVSAAADVLVLMPCGMDAERAAREFESLDGLERWGDLPAVQRRETYVVDSGSLFSRSGPRLVDGLEVLGQILHSELFPEALPREAAIRVERMVG